MFSKRIFSFNLAGRLRQSQTGNGNTDIWQQNPNLSRLYTLVGSTAYLRQAIRKVLLKFLLISISMLKLLALVPALRTLEELRNGKIIAEIRLTAR
jgi:hypothetical protein